MARGVAFRGVCAKESDGFTLRIAEFESTDSEGCDLIPKRGRTPSERIGLRLLGKKALS